MTTSPAREHDLLVLDLDGVVYVGADAVPGAVDALIRAHAGGAGWVFATNNASRTPQEVGVHLRRLGLDVADHEVVTSSQAGAATALERVGAGARVLAVGGPGVAAACLEAGLEPVTSAADDPAAIVQGFGRAVSWSDLAEVAAAVRAGAVWVATNMDPTIPTDRGLMPGNGSLVAAVRTAVGVDPLVAGKPQPGLFAAAARRAGAAHPLVVGDRLDTDIAGAVAAGQTSMLVLTGVSGAEDLLGAADGHRPDLVCADLAGLHTSHPPVVRDGQGWTCRSARVRWDGETADPEPVDPEAGRDTLDGTADDGAGAALDLLRAACTAAWERADREQAGGTGTPPPRLSSSLHARVSALGRAHRPPHPGAVA